MDTNENVKKESFPKAIIILVILAVIALGFGFAFAKYVTSKNGIVSAQIAEFHFQLKNINGESTATAQSSTVEFPITRTDDNKKIQTGLLAPETFGRFDIILDTRGTQVGYKYDINISVTNCPTNLIFYSDKEHNYPIATNRTEEIVGGQKVKIATFTISKYVPLSRANDEHKEIVYWNWPYETGTGEQQIYENDLIDSEDMNKTVSMTIIATASQVNEPPAGIPVVGESKQDISIVKLDMTQVDETSVILDDGESAEVILTYTQNPKPANLEDLFISSSDSSIATASVDSINDKIIINALKKGTTTITLRGEQSWNITKKINVTVQGTFVNELVLSSDSSTVNVVPSGSENVTINNFSNLKPVEPFTVSSSDNNVATAYYDGNGTITISGINIGLASLTLTGCDSATTKTIEVSVKKAPLKIGDSIDYSTQLNGIQLNNWKVFYKDGDYTYIILDDYLPATSIDTSRLTGIATSGIYGAYSTEDRTTFISALETKSNWDSLLSGTLNGTTSINLERNENIWAMGAPTLELWANSWNDSNNGFVMTMRPSGNNTNGYRINSTYYVNIAPADKNKENYKLYFPHISSYNGSLGYWLASPSAAQNGNVMSIYYDGVVSFDKYSVTYYAFRPIICLPSNILEQ